MFKREKEPFVSSGGMREKELITDVQCQQENPNSRVHDLVEIFTSLVLDWNGGPFSWNFPVPVECL